MYLIDLIKIKAQEEISKDWGRANLYDSFFIIRLDEDNNNIIGIVQNNLCWQFLDNDNNSINIEDRDDAGLFDYGDCIIYNKETKKINKYNHYNNDSETDSDSDSDDNNE